MGQLRERQAIMYKVVIETANGGNEYWYLETEKTARELFREMQKDMWECKACYLYHDSYLIDKWESSHA
jgi:hypothetical protein